MRLILWFIVLIPIISYACMASNEPLCSGSENWPASMAYVKLKNAKIINSLIIPSKTKVSKLMSEKIGIDLYRQLHQVEFLDTAGNQFKVLTISDASSEECSMSDVRVYKIEEVK